MDALQRPLRIPPGFSNYAEDKGVFELYSRMLGELIVNKPSDPLQFLVDYLSRPKDNGMMNMHTNTHIHAHAQIHTYAYTCIQMHMHVYARFVSQQPTFEIPTS